MYANIAFLQMPLIYPTIHICCYPSANLALITIGIYLILFRDPFKDDGKLVNMEIITKIDMF